MKSLSLITFLSFIGLTLPGVVFAKEIEGVNIPESITLSNNAALKLNGAGIRKKLFFKIYIGALYLQQNTQDPQIIVEDTGSSCILMHFLYDNLEKDKLTGAWSEGFENNNTPEQFKLLEGRLQQFNAMFGDAKKGDEIRLDYIPDKGTEVWFNDELRGTVEGMDFHSALLKVWLGKKPADEDLKKAMLGK